MRAELRRTVTLWMLGYGCYLIGAGMCHLEAHWAFGLGFGFALWIICDAWDKR